MLLNLKQFTAPYSVGWITKQYELLGQQLAQVACIKWHIEQYPPLKHLLPAIVHWAKAAKLCHDGNVTCPPPIESPKACRWAFLVCSVAPLTCGNNLRDEEAYAATISALFKLDLKSFELKFACRENQWIAIWEQSDRRDCWSMEHIVEGAHLPRGSAGAYLQVSTVKERLWQEIMAIGLLPPPPPLSHLHQTG